MNEHIEVSLDMRFDGQEHSLTVVPEHEHGRLTSSVADLEQAFFAAYQRSFGLVLQDRIQIVSIRASQRRLLPRRRETLSRLKSGPSATLSAFSFAADKRCPFVTQHRGALPEGDRCQGPAIIYEPTTTTYVDVDFSYGVDRNGALILRREES